MATFKKLFDNYHKIDKEVYRVENDIEPASDTTMEDLKKTQACFKRRAFQHT